MSSRARSRSRSRSRERRHKHDRRHRDERDKERDGRDSRSDRDRRDYRDKDRDSRDKRDSHRDRDEKKEKYENKSSGSERGNNDSGRSGDINKNNGVPVPSSGDKSAEPPAPLLPSGLSITKNAAQLASILAKTKQQLEEQKKKLLEKVKETEQTDVKPASVKQEARPAVPSLVPAESAPVKEELDVFAIPVRVPTTLKANQKMQQAEEQRAEQKARTLDKLLKTTGKSVPVAEERIEEQYFDPRLGKDPTRRKKRSFHFVEPGTYIEQADRERDAKRQRVESNESESSATAVKKEEPVSTVSDTAPRDKKTGDQIPDVEWWDLPFLEVTREDSEGRKVSLPPSYDLRVLDDKINKLIEHPTVIAPPAEAPAPPPQQVKLTAAERKKQRRIERARARELEHEKYLLGLTEAPKPKVKISNMMRVYGAEAVQDPTQLEALVKKEMAERQERHEQRNEERKLTPEERREKKRNKMLEDTKLLSHVAVFKIPATALNDPKIRFKIDMNASQNYLSGTGVVTPTMAIIVIEGGPNAIKRYKKLMLRRIPWKTVAGDKTDEAEEDEDDEEQDRERANSRYCQLVWEGEVLKPTFRSFKVEQFAEETAARKFLAENGIPHYWDQAKALPAATELLL